MLSPVRALAGAALAVSVACIPGFETTPAYAEEAFLCDDEGALASEIASCLGDAECGGVISARGVLQGERVTFTNRPSMSALFLVDVADGTQILLDKVEATGVSPYFQFVFKLKSIGGTAEEEFVETRVLSLLNAAGDEIGELSDDLVQLDLRLTSGGESSEFVAANGEGEVRITAQSGEKIVGSFSVALDGDDTLDGCFHLRALETRIEMVSEPP